MCEQTLQGHNAPLSKVLLHENEDVLLAATTSGVIKLWDVQSGKGALPAALLKYLRDVWTVPLQIFLLLLIVLDRGNPLIWHPFCAARRLPGSTPQ